MEHANRLLCLLFGVLSVSESLESPRARDPCRKENPRRLAPSQATVNGSENRIKHQSPSPGPSKGQSQAPVLCEIRFDIKATAKQKCRRAFDVQILLWPKVALPDCNNIELKWITFFSFTRLQFMRKQRQRSVVGCESYVTRCQNRGVKGLVNGFLWIFFGNCFDFMKCFKITALTWKKLENIFFES